MAIDPVFALPPFDAPAAASSGTPPVASSASFAQLVADGLRGVSDRLQASQADLQRLAAGEAENLHHVMLRLEQSRLSLQLLLQVRHRLLESFQEVMRMPV